MGLQKSAKNSTFLHQNIVGQGHLLQKLRFLDHPELRNEFCSDKRLACSIDCAPKPIRIKAAKNISALLFSHFSRFRATA